ncbi:MAG: hypothetical protein AAF533_01250 [Acidobacteriota bacterium]
MATHLHAIITAADAQALLEQARPLDEFASLEGEHLHVRFIGGQAEERLESLLESAFERVVAVQSEDGVEDFQLMTRQGGGRWEHHFDWEGEELEDLFLADDGEEPDPLGVLARLFADS